MIDTRILIFIQMHGLIIWKRYHDASQTYHKMSVQLACLLFMQAVTFSFVFIWQSMQCEFFYFSNQIGVQHQNSTA